MQRRILRLVLALGLLFVAASVGAIGPFNPPYGATAPDDDEPLEVTVVGSYPNVLVIVWTGESSGSG